MQCLCFNTTLVTVYQSIRKKPEQQECFNTTLVTVYRRAVLIAKSRLKVSIQPLLLFIYLNPTEAFMIYEFQYNPCYCLSQTFLRELSFLTAVSIQPLLLFIPSHLKAFNFPSLVLYRIKPDFFNIFPSDSAKFEFFTKSLYFRYFSQYPEFGGW